MEGRRGFSLACDECRLMFLVSFFFFCYLSYFSLVLFFPSILLVHTSVFLLMFCLGLRYLSRRPAIDGGLGADIEPANVSYRFGLGYIHCCLLHGVYDLFSC